MMKENELFFSRIFVFAIFIFGNIAVNFIYGIITSCVENVLRKYCSFACILNNDKIDIEPAN